MLYTPEALYEATRHFGEQYGYTYPEWDELSWPEKDEWQARADELSEVRRELEDA